MWFGSPWKSLFRMVYPTIIGTFIISSYEILDKFIATHVGVEQWWKSHIKFPSLDIENAQSIINVAMAYAAPPYLILAAFSFFISLGTSVNFSIFYGRGEKERMRFFVGNGLVLTLILSIFTHIVLGMLVERIIDFEMSSGGKQLTDAEQVIRENAINYTRALINMASFLYVSNFFLSLLRAEGRSFLSTAIISISVITNVMLDIIFLHFFGWGMVSTAYATGISWCVSILACLFVIFRKGSDSELTFKRLHLKLKRSIITIILMVGLTSFFQNIFSGLLSMFSSRLLNSLPPIEGRQDIPIQLYGGIMPWFLLFNAPIIGVTQGARMLISSNYGRKNYVRTFSLIKRVFFLFLIFSIFSEIMVLAFAGAMVELFGVAKQIAENYDFYLKFQFSFYIFSPFYFISITTFQAINRPKIALVCSLARGVILPLMMIVTGFVIATLTGRAEFYYLCLGVIDLIGFSLFLPLLVIGYHKYRSFLRGVYIS